MSLWDNPLKYSYEKADIYRPKSNLAYAQEIKFNSSSSIAKK